MPSPEEFAPRAAQSMMTPERMEELRARARAVRHAQATGAPIPGTDYATTAPAAVPVQPPAQLMASPAPVGAAPTAYMPQPQTELELVRMRFKLASYYEALIAEPVFGDDVYSDPYAAQVHAEVTEWASNRMAELAGVRQNPEGFLDDEVQLLKTLAQSLGPDGVKALVFLADRVLNPPAPPPAPPAAPAQPTWTPSPSHGPNGSTVTAAPAEAPAEVPQDEDEGSSAMSLSVAPAPQPAAPAAAPPQVAPAKPRSPRVRRARVPGAPAVTTQPGADVAPQGEQPAPQKRRGKRAADPLAAGRALVASAAQPEVQSAPAAAPGAPAPAAAAPAVNHPAPVPMPKGLGMSMAMEQKAGEALRDAKVIEATGGGVM